MIPNKKMLATIQQRKLSNNKDVFYLIIRVHNVYFSSFYRLIYLEIYYVIK